MDTPETVLNTFQWGCDDEPEGKPALIIRNRAIPNEYEILTDETEGDGENNQS